MRYVIVSVVRGEAGKFNEELRKEVLADFGVKSSKLPAHITLKAPFEYDGSISELEDAIEEFALENQGEEYKIEGFKSFDDRVIYMNVIDNEQIRNLHKRFIEKIEKIKFINLGNKEGKKAIFHITISSKKLSPKFDEVWNYVNERKCSFTAKYDNITIYKWQNNTWELHKTFMLK